VDDLIPALRRGEIDLAVGAWPRFADPAFATEVLAQDRSRCSRAPAIRLPGAGSS
jgi:DNA-binding transcriptional LysR family regulator